VLLRVSPSGDAKPGSLSWGRFTETTESGLLN